MTLLKINGEYYFASAWVPDAEDRKHLPSQAERMIETKEEFDYALFELCWHLRDCHEAIEVFTEFEECPVCLSRASESGHLIHRDPKLVLN